MKEIAPGLWHLAGDRRTADVLHLISWLRLVPSIRAEFHGWDDDTDPFDYNEATSVATLAIAASRAGLLSLTEYVAFKRHLTRGRAFRNGRCDLWLAHSKGSSWGYEFKQFFATAASRADTIGLRLGRAVTDARGVSSDEANVRMGALIVVGVDSHRWSPQAVDRMDSIMSSLPISFRVDDRKPLLWVAFQHCR